MVGWKSRPSTADAESHSGSRRGRERPEHDDTRPPSYQDTQSSRGILAGEMETLTTTVTTTTQTTRTTTQFFSFPLWRRRMLPEQNNSPNKAQEAVDEFGMAHTTSSLKLDKDLPATPPDEDMSTATSDVSTGPDFRPDGGDTSLGTSVDSRNSNIGLSSYATQSDRSPRISFSASQDQPAMTLAHAALGLGLPHVMPQVSSPSILSQRAPSGSSSPPTGLRAVPPAAPVRRAKSFSRILKSTTSPDGAESDTVIRRRARGLSMFVPPGAVGNSMGKEGGINNNSTTQKTGDLPSEVKVVEKRPSFWRRKRLQSLPQTQGQQPAGGHTEGLEAPSLPLVQPISPFLVHTSFQPPQDPPQSPQSRVDLQRRHSEKSASFSSSRSPHTEHAAFVAPPVPLRSPLRPITDGPLSSSADALLEHPTNSWVTTPSGAPGPSTTPAHPSRALLLERERRPSLTPVARPRSATNSPRILQRLSMGFFSTSPGTPISSPTSTTHVVSEMLTSSPIPSPSSFPKASLSRPADIPKPPKHGESPELFLTRLEQAVSKAEIANVLASSGDTIYTQALKAYIGRFDFTHNALDIALRKLLMDVGLPKETQQIDRVVEAFAQRYCECNRNIFTSDDQAYILAFSMIMLHTDVFNKSNKRKMTKSDYIKNTKLPGVSVEVLDCFYDNITFAPFIFIEDPVDVNGQRGLPHEGGLRTPTVTVTTSVQSSSSTTLLGKANKVDPYFLITQDLLDSLRVDVVTHIPLQNPFSYLGTAGSWDEEKLHRAFARAGIIEVGPSDGSRVSALPFFTLSVGGAPGPIMSTVAGLDLPDILSEPMMKEPMTSLKITKVGLLNRKEEMGDGGKKAQGRKWKEWSVILTGSQLVFYKDPTWALTLIAQISDTPAGSALPQDFTFLKPDELLSVKDAVAVHDISYDKHPYTLRFALPTGRQFLLQAESEQERNEWIAHINYASAFKTAGIRMRTIGLNETEINLTGKAAAASHLRERRRNNANNSMVHTWTTDHPRELASPNSDSLSGEDSSSRVDAPPSILSRKTSESVTPLPADDRQLKMTFDQVKAELASGAIPSVAYAEVLSDEPATHSNSPPLSPVAHNGAGTLMHSRTQIIRLKIRDLDARMEVTERQLDSDMNIVRNIAVLTPFCRSTRDRLQSSIISMSRRVMQVRLEMAKMQCHRDVLASDIAAERREWKRTKSQALQAATAVLRNIDELDIGHRADSEHRGAPPYIDRTRTALIVNQGETDSPTVRARELGTPAISPQSLSAKQAPFHRYVLLDTGETAMPQDLDGSNGFDTNSSPLSHDNVYQARNRSMLINAQQESDAQNHTPVENTTDSEQHYNQQEPDEEAEEWDRTRAAKRVSLVRLPSSFSVSAIMGRTANTTSIKEAKEGEDTFSSRAVTP